ncbi:MAG: NAD(P)H-dependent oxidoreductase [Actinomycetota bacterium]
MRVLLVDGRRQSVEGTGPAVDTAVDTVAVAEAALAERAHETTVLSLTGEGFDRYMSTEERRAYHEADNLVTPAQQRSAELLRSAEALLVVGAIRGGTIDPLVKSWFERVFVPGVSFAFTDSGRITRALTHIRRVGMILSCPDGDAAPHRRGASTRSVLRGVRLNAARSCRSTYVALGPADDVEATVTRALARW